MNQLTEVPPASMSDDAIQRAIAFGIDITLLIDNLRLTPTQRVQRLQRAVDSIQALRAEVMAQQNRDDAPGTD